MQRRRQPSRRAEVAPLPFRSEEMQRAVSLEEFQNTYPAAEVQKARAATHRHVLTMVDGLAGLLFDVRSRSSPQSPSGFKQLHAKAALAKRRGSGETRQPATDDGDGCWWIRNGRACAVNL